jgi:hypothetical protein
MVHSPLRSCGIRGAGVVLALALLLVPLLPDCRVCRANPASGLFDVLNPGIARDLGLGGDPFRSSLTDQASWWGDSMQAAEAVLAYRLEYFEPISPRLTRGRGWLRHRGNEVRGASSVPVGNGRLFGQLGLTHQDQELMADDLGNRYSLTGKGGQGDLLLRLQGLPAGLALQFSAPLGASSDRMRSMPLGIGIRYGIPDRIIFQASTVRRLYDHAVDLAIEDDTIASFLNLARVISTVDTRIHLGAASWLAYTLRSNKFGNIDQLTDAYRYEIIPVGRSIAYELELVVGRKEDYAVLLRGVWLDFDVGGSAHWGGQRFGRINYFKGDHRTGVVAFEKTGGGNTRWLADITVTELRGRVWGNIESWPFTDSLGDLLGARMTFKGRARAHWMRYHAGLDREVGRGRLKVGLAWYNIFPEAEVQSWRSGLGFPLGSRDNYTLETDHLQLAAVSLGGSIPWGRFRCKGEVFQVVYGNIHNTLKRPEDNVEDPVEAAAARPTGWFGGTYARVGVHYRF